MKEVKEVQKAFDVRLEEQAAKLKKEVQQKLEQSLKSAKTPRCVRVTAVQLCKFLIDGRSLPGLLDSKALRTCHLSLWIYSLSIMMTIQVFPVVWKDQIKPMDERLKALADSCFPSQNC